MRCTQRPAWPPATPGSRQISKATSREKRQLSMAASLVRLDLNALALPQKMAGILDVSIDARGEGSDLQPLVANAKISAQPLRVGSTAVGSFELIGGARQGNVQLHRNLTNGTGHMN